MGRCRCSHHLRDGLVPNLFPEGANEGLIGRHQKNLTTVLVVDEAHYLSTELLEEIRLLTNLETPQAKLLPRILKKSRRACGTYRRRVYRSSAL